MEKRTESWMSDNVTRVCAAYDLLDRSEMALDVLHNIPYAKSLFERAMLCVELADRAFVLACDSHSNKA